MATAFQVSSTVMRPPVPESPLGRSVEQLMQAVQDLVEQVPGGVAASAGRFGATAGKPEASPADVALSNARMLVAMRKLRERAFGADLFSDPAWNILVELYVALAEGVKVTVGNACIASALPLTSALRLCQELQLRKLVLRERDPFDRRRVLLILADETRQALTRVLAAGRLALAD